MNLIKPKKLQKGDTAAIISPSWGGPSVFPKVYEKGLEILKSEFNLKIKEFPTARMSAEKLYENPRLRADDINNAFADKSISAIIASIGGDDSIRILPYINKETIKHNPKIFMGYSDTTSINTYLNQLGLVTFNGPTVMAGFSQMKNYPDYIKNVKDILFENPETYKFKSYKKWSEKYPNWSVKENIGKSGILHKNEGWRFIQGFGSSEGELFGGCIEILNMLNGTKFWPKKNFWKNKILFIETSEDKPSPDYIKYTLRNFGIQGILNKISGVLVGRPRDYTPKEKQELNSNLLKISKEFNLESLPIVTNVDFGHTDPQFILPLGIKIKIDTKNKSLELIEKPLRG